MKKFIFHFGLFVTIGIIIFGSLSKFADAFDSKSDFRIDQLLSKADSIEALAIGNSHSCALDFDALNIRGYRVAQGGNDLFEAEYQLKSLSSLLPNLEIVFFNISYFSFFEDNSAVPDHYSYFNKIDFKKLISQYPDVTQIIEPMEFNNYVVINTDDLSAQQKNKLGPALDIINNNISNGLKLRQDYYNSIPSFKWVRGDFTNFVESKLSSIIREDHWKEVLYSLLKGKKDNIKETGIDKYGQFTNDLVRSFKSKDSLEVLAKEIQVPMYLFGENFTLKYNENVLKDTYNSIVSIINYAKEKNIRLIFYTTPVYKSFTDYYSKESINVMRNKMKLLKKEFGIEYYDFSEDTKFISNNKFYYNSDHLNKNGAKEFSENLIKIVAAKDVKNGNKIMNLNMKVLGL